MAIAWDAEDENDINFEFNLGTFNPQICKTCGSVHDIAYSCEATILAGIYQDNILGRPTPE